MDNAAFQALSIGLPVVTVVASGLATLIVYSSRANRALINQLTADVRVLQTQVAPFWSSLQSKVADSLHNPDPKSKELDALLEKLVNLKLTTGELHDLVNRLNMIRRTGPTDISQKADTLLRIMPLVVAEIAGDLPATDQRTMEQKNVQK